MGIKFSIKITNDSGEEKPFEEYREEKKERIHNIISKLEALRDELDDLISEEEEYRDSLPEGTLYSELCDESEEISDKLEDARSSLDDSIDSLDTINT